MIEIVFVTHGVSLLSSNLERKTCGDFKDAWKHSFQTEIIQMQIRIWIWVQIRTY